MGPVGRGADRPSRVPGTLRCPSASRALRAVPARPCGVPGAPAPFPARPHPVRSPRDPHPSHARPGRPARPSRGPGPCRRPSDRRRPCGCAEEGLVGVLADREDGTVVRHGALVVKAHAPDTDPEAHRARLALAARPDVAGVLLSPLPLPPAAPEELGGRPVSAWPYGAPVDLGTPTPLRGRRRRGSRPAPPHPAPARGRGRPSGDAGPAQGGPRRGPDAPGRAGPPGRGHRPRRPADGPRSPRARPRLLCHGDFHLGQLVRPAPAPSAPAAWRLIDVDDLGTGTRPGTWPVRPPGSPPASCPRRSGPASSARTGRRAARPWAPTPGPNWTCRPVP